MNPRKGRSSNSKEMGISEEPSRNCCFQLFNQFIGKTLQVNTPSMLQWKLRLCSLKFVNRQGGATMPKWKEIHWLVLPPSPKHKHWNIGVKEKSFAAYILYTIFSYVFLYHSKITSTSQLLLAKQRNWKSLLLVLHGLRLFSFLHTGGCKSFQGQRHVMRCRRVGRVIYNAKTYFKVNCHLKEPHFMNICHTYTSIKGICWSLFNLFWLRRDDML